MLRLGSLALALAVLAPFQLAQTTTTADTGVLATQGVRLDRAPLLSSSLPQFAEIDLGATESVQFSVSARDYDGDEITVRFLNPPPGSEIRPVSGVGSATLQVSWTPPGDGLYGLVFQAEDANWQTIYVQNVVVSGASLQSRPMQEQSTDLATQLVELAGPVASTCNHVDLVAAPLGLVIPAGLR